MIESTQQKAEKLITYSIANAPNLADAVAGFNAISSQIKSKDYSFCKNLIDEELA